ncbi:MAG: hypothetical protein LBS09_01080 [Bacteroidales bacterium]|nr:hypothetical protein [Bacteroidales bacterium]
MIVRLKHIIAALYPFFTESRPYAMKNRAVREQTPNIRRNMRFGQENFVHRAI